MMKLVLSQIMALLFLSVNIASCNGNQRMDTLKGPKIVPASWQTEQYMDQLEGKRVGLLVNHSSTIGKTHLIDTLSRRGVDLRLVMSPEHGLLGLADDGERIEKAEIDLNVPFVSLYGKKKKPTPEDLDMIDLLIFDIQDVGARFYTYISTMHLAMEACAESGVEMMILDRPNPNGHYVDGPVLDLRYISFVGMHPIPVVHGLTVGELARMIEGEGWLETDQKLALTVITCKGYRHDLPYYLPVRPSPNLPNQRAVWLYPSLCFFEGTTVSVGRGTAAPFQQIGHPDFTNGNHRFKPVPSFGSRHPKHEGKSCRGYDFTSIPSDSVFMWKEVKLDWLIEFYRNMPENFFRSDGYFDKLAGTPRLRRQIQEGLSAEQIQASWQEDLQAYLNMRKKYLLYPDFN